LPALLQPSSTDLAVGRPASKHGVPPASRGDGGLVVVVIIFEKESVDRMRLATTSTPR